LPERRNDGNIDRRQQTVNRMPGSATQPRLIHSWGNDPVDARVERPAAAAGNPA
jgi:hypothetical protein